MVSETNRRLILELQRDGAASYAHLARRLGITTQTVAKRMEGLIHSDIMQIRALPNPYRLGLSANALIAVKVEPSKTDEVCDALIDNFYVNLVQPVFGRFDILMIVYFPNWDMLHDFINNELNHVDGIMKVEPYFIKDIVKRYERLFIKEPYHEGPSKMKDVDWTLIRELSENGRAHAGDLAEKLGLHVTTVYRRIASLLNNNVIKISAVPNPAAFGYLSNAHIAMDAQADRVAAICTRLHSYPDIHLIMTMVNGSGIIAGIHKESNETLYGFIKDKIAGLKGIRNTETFIRTEIRKRYYGWFLDDADEA
jgi:Lrp/AsnC family transcriptional regulator for asnA, asnC and gidA